VKRLTLMRHANAQWKDPQLADFERPLSRRGQSEAEAMGRRFVELHLAPTVVVTSPARRARQTADIMVREVGLPARNLRTEESLYLAPSEEILRIIRSTGPRIPHLMIVGHNPGISELSNLLAPLSHAREITTAGMCSLSFDVHSWADIDSDKLRDTLAEAPPVRMFALWA
jgi:phosphohistidine phosphatase